jgi:hypothetical protein
VTNEEHRSGFERGVKEARELRDPKTLPGRKAAIRYFYGRCVGQIAAPWASDYHIGYVGGFETETRMALASPPEIN